MLTLIWCPFHPRITVEACKRLRHSAKSAGGRLHLNTHTPLTQRSRSGLTMPLSRHSVGTYPETSSHATCQGKIGQSSQLAEPLWTDPVLKSGVSVSELIFTLKKRSAGGECIAEPFHQNHTRGKSHLLNAAFRLELGVPPVQLLKTGKKEKKTHERPGSSGRPGPGEAQGQ